MSLLPETQLGPYRIVYVTYIEDFAPLWKDPRYEALLVRMGVR